MLGEWTSASARSSLRFIPPEYVRTLRSAACVEPDALEQLLAPARALVPREPMHGGLKPQVLAAREQGVERGLLQRGADGCAHLRAFADDVVARDAGGSFRRREQRDEHVHGGGLAGAVRAEEAVDLAGGDVEVDPVDRARAFLEDADEPARLDSVTVGHPLYASGGPVARDGRSGTPMPKARASSESRPGTEHHRH